MQRKLEAGYKPNDIVDNSHIWRVFAGDRLVWVGKQRSGMECDNGVLSIFTFNENAAIVGESSLYMTKIILRIFCVVFLDVKTRR